MDNNDCIFCDRTKFEERLIFENEYWYLIASLGQITNGGYVLIVPKEHILCMGALPSHRSYNNKQDGKRESMLRIMESACLALSLEYQHSTMMFEHGIVGQTIKHAHLHLLPTAVDLTSKIRADFPRAEFEEFWHPAHLQKLYSQRLQPYLFWTVPPNVKSVVCWNPPAPLQYLRLITAKLLGYPERGNWRNMDPKLDKELWQATVARLKPYFARRAY